MCTMRRSSARISVVRWSSVVDEALFGPRQNRIDDRTLMRLAGPAWRFDRGRKLCAYREVFTGFTRPTSNGGPNGIRTRVPIPPRAFASESTTCGMLSQRASGGDGNPEAVCVSEVESARLWWPMDLLQQSFKAVCRKSLVRSVTGEIDEFRIRLRWATWFWVEFPLRPSPEKRNTAQPRDADRVLLEPELLGVLDNFRQRGLVRKRTVQPNGLQQQHLP